MRAFFMARDTLTKDEWPYSPKFQEFATFLGLPAEKDAKGVNWRQDKKMANKMEALYAWGKYRAESEDIVDVMLAVRQLQKDLGVNSRGKTLVDHLWGWTQLDTKTDKLAKQMERIEKEKTLYTESQQDVETESRGEHSE